MPIITGMIGIISGTLIANRWKKKSKSSKPDAWVSGMGLLFSSPFLFLGLVVVQVNSTIRGTMLKISITNQ
jgi:hypothetical protein